MFKKIYGKWSKIHIALRGAILIAVSVILALLIELFFNISCIIGIILYFVNKAHLPRKSHVIMASTIIGCATWCVALLLFNIVHGMNIDIFSSFQEIISGSI